MKEKEKAVSFGWGSVTVLTDNLTCYIAARERSIKKRLSRIGWPGVLFIQFFITFVYLCMLCCVWGGGIKIQFEGVGFLLLPCSPLVCSSLDWVNLGGKDHPEREQCHLRSQALDWVKGTEWSTGTLHELATDITAQLIPPVMGYSLELWANYTLLP